jgi:hypothetical protein
MTSKTSITLIGIPITHHKFFSSLLTTSFTTWSWSIIIMIIHIMDLEYHHHHHSQHGDGMESSSLFFASISIIITIIPHHQSVQDSYNIINISSMKLKLQHHHHL